MWGHDANLTQHSTEALIVPAHKFQKGTIAGNLGGCCCCRWPCMGSLMWREEVFTIFHNAGTISFSWHHSECHCPSAAMSPSDKYRLFVVHLVLPDLLQETRSKYTSKPLYHNNRMEDSLDYSRNHANLDSTMIWAYINPCQPTLHYMISATLHWW